MAGPASGKRAAGSRSSCVVFDFAFKCAVVVRYWIFVKPNEPVIQLPFIARHVDATREAYRLGGREGGRFPSEPARATRCPSAERCSPARR